MEETVLAASAWGFALAALAGAICGLLSAVVARRLVDCEAFTAKGYFNAVAAGMIGFAFLFYVFGWSIQGVAFAVLLLVLMTASVADLAAYTIPNVLVVVVAIVWAGYVLALYVAGFAYVSGLLVKGLLGAVITGGVVLGFSLLFEKITGKQSLGGGDIKLFCALGLFLGWEDGLFCVVIACMFGLLFGVLLCRRGNETAGQTPIPFGPAISLAAMGILMVYGPLLS